MSTDLFNISWFIIFLFVMFIALVANIIIILAILRDKSMYTSTYFYIINVNIADIILILSCLPERVAAVFYSNGGFQLGIYTCKLKRTWYFQEIIEKECREYDSLYEFLTFFNDIMLLCRFKKDSLDKIVIIIFHGLNISEKACILHDKSSLFILRPNLD